MPSQPCSAVPAGSVTMAVTIRCRIKNGCNRVVLILFCARPAPGPSSSHQDRRDLASTALTAAVLADRIAPGCRNTSHHQCRSLQGVWTRLLATETSSVRWLASLTRLAIILGASPTTPPSLGCRSKGSSWSVIEG